MYIVDDDQSARIGLPRLCVLLTTMSIRMHLQISFLRLSNLKELGIVLDARMPGQSGVELAEILRDE